MCRIRIPLIEKEIFVQSFMSRVDLRLPEAGAEIAAQAAVNPSLLGQPSARLPQARPEHPAAAVLLDDADCRKSLLDIKRGSEIEPGLYLKMPRDREVTGQP